MQPSAMQRVRDARWRAQRGGLVRRLISLLALGALASPARAQASSSQETQVRHAVQAFYAAFNSHHFDHVSDFTTDDWNHINPLGGRTRGREAVLKELREVHATFLKHVTDSIKRMDVRFATPDVAIATVVSRVSAFTTPDGVKHDNEEQVRTFVVVRRGGRWLIMQDHNTIVTPLPRSRASR